MFLSEWLEFPSAPCVVEEKKNLMTARVSMLLKSPRPWHASELVSFLFGLRTHRHSGTPIARMNNFRLRHIGLALSLSIYIYIYIYISYAIFLEGSDFDMCIVVCLITLSVCGLLLLPRVLSSEYTVDILVSRAISHRLSLSVGR